jgi:ribA/ribD-fused uncharacterized protein
MYQTTDTYHFYWNGPFSQWQRAEFELDGVVFLTAEQAMMYHKALLFEDTDVAAKILKAEDPGKQKALGRQVRNFDEDVWDGRKRNIVKRINYAKFSQNKGLRRKLFQSGNKLLAEASPVDTIWGVGLDAATAAVTDPAMWPGQNLLGQIITEVREELRLKFPDETVQQA